VQLFDNIKIVREFIDNKKKCHAKIGFIPTMGALHKGHLALVKKAQEENDMVIVSIFVNKAQFNDVKDYQLYPQNLERDLKMLSDLGVDAVFAPHHHEIYPNDCSFTIQPNTLLDCLCALHRRGHFEGVALVITKLFNIIQPHSAYFGEKDFQQLAIIRKLVRDLNFNIDIIACETVREASGLAMSSRNQRLSPVSLVKAGMIYKVLCDIKSNPALISQKKQELVDSGFDKIDYLEIREEENLKLNMDLNSSQKRRIFIAGYIEGVRLIDNLSI